MSSLSLLVPPHPALASDTAPAFRRPAAGGRLRDPGTPRETPDSGPFPDLPDFGDPGNVFETTQHDNNGHIFRVGDRVIPGSHLHTGDAAVNPFPDGHDTFHRNLMGRACYEDQRLRGTGHITRNGYFLVNGLLGKLDDPFCTFSLLQGSIGRAQP